MGALPEGVAEKNAQTVETLIEKLAEPRRSQVLKMFETIGLEYFSAPASGREDYHGCYPGGLTDHSLRVTKFLLQLAKTLAPDKYADRELIFLGLMHDLGKVGDPPVSPLYVPNPNEWGRKRGFLYETTKDLPYMPVCDRTMYLIQKYGIQLKPHEYIALRISDGPSEKCNEKYSMKEPDLALLLHMADRWACAVEKTVP